MSHPLGILPPMERRLDAVTAQQHNMFTAAQAEAAGYSTHQRKWRRTNNIWIEAGAGVYQLGGVAPTWRGKLHAALLDAGDRSLVSHGSAGRLHRFPGFTTPVVEILVPYGLDHESTAATVHECRRFEHVPTSVTDGLRVTSPEATLVLLAGSMRLG